MKITVNFHSADTTGMKKFKNWFSFLIKLFSMRERKRIKTSLTFNQIPTHVSGDAFYVRKDHYIFEAIGRGVELSKYYKPEIQFYFTQVPDAIQEAVMDELIDEFLHKNYAYIQSLSYIKRYFLSFFKPDTRNCGVIFNLGANCTEVYYWYFHTIASVMGYDVDFIEHWDSNMVYPIDILTIAEYFEENNLGKIDNYT